MNHAGKIGNGAIGETIITSGFLNITGRKKHLNINKNHFKTLFLS